MDASLDERARRAIEPLSCAEDREYIGEPVSQLAHALQCAELARDAGGSDHEILAALFHDIGHIAAGPDALQMPGLGVLAHESVGAQFLRELGFSAEVCDLVGSHVNAKRYLAWRKASYHDALSAASRATLALQGGPMSADEAVRFEQDPAFAARLRLRVWDEAAKDPARVTAGLTSYLPLIRAHLGGAS
ncbi:MAG TPA: HD domain-containing protein [Polyangiales bacterium]|jgi:putative nucleotidyltransferase with HDIG domain|nr:HD domain-containing protein [Polyangiales bacterium]